MAPIVHIDQRCPGSSPRMKPSSILVLVVAEVEKGVAVITVNAEVPPGQDLEADAAVPAELGRGDFEVGTLEYRRDDPVLYG